MLGTSQLGISFAYPIYAMPCLCFSYLVPAALFLCCSKLCNAFAILLEAKPFLRCSLQGSAALFLCHSTPRLCVSSLCRASHFLCFSFSPLCLALPLLFYATLLPAYQFLCRSIHCDDVPLQVTVLLSQSFADQLLAMRCLCFAILRIALPSSALPLRG